MNPSLKEGGREERRKGKGGKGRAERQIPESMVSQCRHTEGKQLDLRQNLAAQNKKALWASFPTSGPPADGLAQQVQGMFTQQRPANQQPCLSSNPSVLT